MGRNTNTAPQLSSNVTIQAGFMEAQSILGINFFNLIVVPQTKDRVLRMTLGPNSDINYLPKTEEQISIIFDAWIIRPRPPLAYMITLDISPIYASDTLQDVREGYNGLAGTSAGLSSSSIAPLTLMAINRLNSVTVTGDCPNDDEMTLDFPANPAQQYIGTEFNVRVHLGCVVYNVMILAGIAVAHLVAIFIVQQVDSMYYSHKHLLMYYVHWMHFPHYTFLCTFFFMQPILSSSLFVTIQSKNGAHRVIAATIGLCVLSYCLYCVSVTIGPRFRAHYLLDKPHTTQPTAPLSLPFPQMPQLPQMPQIPQLPQMPQLP
eukprot:PhF_6_TR13400/c0_g1_i5/m.21303